MLLGGEALLPASVGVEVSLSEVCIPFGGKQARGHVIFYSASMRCRFYLGIS